MESLNQADPRELGGIALRGRLGQGGMGTVYFGITEDGEPVAVKTIRSELLGKQVVRSRFEREALALGMVQGPRIGALLGASGPDDVPPWLAVEYVRGLTLKEYVEEKGPLAADTGAALGLLLAEALTDIHTPGLLHRDLKPANVILGSDGPKVIDFGLVALIDEAGDITRSGDLLGTPQCMAPEQALHRRDLPSATDIYALGVTLVFAMTGHYLYDRPTTAALMMAIIDPDTEPDLSGLPETMRAPVLAMLADDPAARPELDEIIATLTARLAESGDTPSAAAVQLAGLTYIERSSDPQDTVQPVRSRRLERDEPHVPSDLVRQVADSLRQGYARDARF